MKNTKLTKLETARRCVNMFAITYFTVRLISNLLK